MLTEGPVDGDSGEAEGKDEAAERNVEIGGPLHLIGVSLLDFQVGEVPFGRPEEGGRRCRQPGLGGPQYLGKHDYIVSKGISLQLNCHPGQSLVYLSS